VTTTNATAAIGARLTKKSPNVRSVAPAMQIDRDQVVPLTPPPQRRAAQRRDLDLRHRAIGEQLVDLLAQPTPQQRAG